jgi:N-methylhydantoinase A/oxoprolinase/acetone carboxylase beta subunit
MQFDGQGLIREEIIGRAALTPTDLFHITGEYAPWNKDAAELAAEIFTRLIGLSIDDLIKTVKEKMAETITEEIVAFITRQPLERYPSYVPLNNLGAWLFEENLTHKSPYLGSQIKLKMPVIGIGAPAGLLLPPVAEMLHTDLILPEHYEVANAIGAVVGGVIVTKEAWVYPKLRNKFPVGFIVQSEKERKVFQKMDEAIAFANDVLKEVTSEAVRQSGAEVNDYEVVTIPEGAESCRIRVTAIGVPKI